MPDASDGEGCPPETRTSVADEETLQRGVRPSDVDEDGHPIDRAFPVSDLKDPARGGISVHRKRTGDKQEVSPITDRWEKHVEAKAGNVRSIRTEEDKQAFEVDAAPTPDDDNHALVRFQDRTNPPVSPRRERDKLLEEFQVPEKVAKGKQEDAAKTKSKSKQEQPPGL